MNELEQFLSRNTIECRPMHARITRAQCGVNITSGDYGYCQNCEERHKAIFDGRKKKDGWKFNPFEVRSYTPLTPKKKEVKVDKTDPNERKLTHTQLARLANVTAGCVSYALTLIAKGRTDLPDKAAKIKNAIDKHGLILRGRSVYEAGTVLPPVVDVPEAVVDEVLEDAIQSAVGSVGSALKVTDDEKGGCDNRCRPDYGVDFPLGHIPLEVLVTEITRRMPKAEVVLR